MRSLFGAKCWKKQDDTDSHANESEGNKSLATGSKDKTAQLGDASARGDNLQPLATFKHENPLFSPDGKYLATASVDKTVKLWAVPSVESFTEYLNGLAEDKK